VCQLPIFSTTILLFTCAVATLMASCPGGGGGQGGGGSTVPPGTYRTCRYTANSLQVPTPQGYLVNNYISTDQVQCPPPLNSGLSFTEIEFIHYPDFKVGQQYEVCIPNPLYPFPPDISDDRAGTDLTKCQPEPNVQPPPVGAQTRIVHRTR